MNDAELRGKAIEARRAYQREWRRKNPDKVKANAMRYWQKKALVSMQQDAKEKI